ncbi:hypothetical protein EVAR_33653_1 [Eumeta japonica]|uniref:Mariner Mos1 transposase n=1 Tax=Eumeta variegata TaxID=151549 RepID=A0A4C1VPJ2_EUMVA|nr:hypothetical protein EVAR_33653_1 [Eumeta japonica]
MGAVTGHPPAGREENDSQVTQQVASQQASSSNQVTSDKFNDGRPSIAVYNKNIDAVRRMIETDRRVTYHEIRASLAMGTASVGCNAMLTKFNEKASNLLWYIVTGDEISIYCYDPKTKQQTTVWVYRKKRNRPKWRASEVPLSE